jgi:hypothetical protein
VDAAQLRPLSIGEILDVAIKIYRERFTNLVKAVAVVVGPISVFSALVQVSAFPDGTEFDPAVETTFDFGDFWAFMAGILVVGLVSFVASEVATAASFKIVSGAYLNAEPDWRESLRFAVSRLRSLVWLALLTGFLLTLGLLACIVPGVYFYGAWAVAVPALLLEDSRGRNALKRSRELVTGRWWPTVAAVLVATILASIVQAMFSGLLLAVVVGDGNDVVRAAAQAIASTAGSVLTTPFTAAVITAVYFDLRVRKEGFDLELLARRVGIEPPPGARTDFLPPVAPTGEAQPPFWPPPPGWRPPDA